MIYTFYSYKGGVGRSMALANIAEWLYRQGRQRVIMIDWDLEAPGLESFFLRPDERAVVQSQTGLVDMLEAYKQRASALPFPADESDFEVAAEDVLDQVMWDETDAESLTMVLERHKWQNGEQSQKAVEAIQALINADKANIQSITQVLKSHASSDSRTAEAIQAVFEDYLPHPRHYLFPLHPPEDPKEETSPGLWLLPAGLRSEDQFATYARAVQEFDWVGFYSTYHGEAYFDWLRAELLGFADVVLIDSRTGVTEMGGVCTRQMADMVVLLTAPNSQNLSGIELMAKSFTRPEVLRARKDRSLELVVIPTRLDKDELEDRNEFENRFNDTLSKLEHVVKKKESFWEFGIPYIAKYAYVDRLAVGATGAYRARELETAYENLARFLFEYQHPDQREAFLEQKQKVEEQQVVVPYPGLKAFDSARTSYFFGREAVVDRLLEVLEAKEMVVVAGPSGSGKTSLVQAGLVPALQEGALPGSTAWPVIILKADKNPFSQLARAFRLQGRASPDLDRRDLENVATKLAAERDFLPEFVDDIAAAAGADRIVIIVDQVEKLFFQDEAEGRHFIGQLLAAVKYKAAVLVLVVRSDQLKPLVAQGPGDQMQAAVVRLGPLTKDEMRRAIVEPVRRMGLTFEPGLVERLLDAVGVMPGSLMFLQYVLKELWDHQQNNRLTHAAYEREGNVARAVNAWTESTLQSFSPDDRDRMRRMCLRLVDVFAHSRRRATRDEIDEETFLIANKMAAGGLFVIGADENTGETTIELSHDALLTEWKQLRDWINEDREFLVWRQALAWERQRGSLRGNRLKHALKWRDKREEDLAPRELRYIKESQNQQVRLRRRRSMSLTVLGVLAAVIVLSIAFNWYQDKQDERRAASRTLALKASNILEEQRDLALLLSVEATYLSSDSVVRQTLYSALEEDASLTKILRGHQPDADGDDWVRSVSFNGDGTRLVSGGLDGTVRLWDVETGEQLETPLTGHQPDAFGYAWVPSVSFSPDDRLLASGGMDGTVRLWDVETRRQLGTPLIGHRINVFGDAAVYSVSFSPDGRRLASGGGDGTVRLWDVETGQPVDSLTGHDAAVWSVSFSPDGRVLASGGGDGTVRLWDVETGRQLGTPLTGHQPDQYGDARVYSVSFSPDGRVLVSGGGDGTVRLWDMRPGAREGQQLHDETAQDSAYRVALSPDGRRLASASVGADGSTLRLWDVDTRQPLPGAVSVRNTVRRLVFSLDGLQLLVIGADSTVKLWDLQKGGRLADSLSGVAGPIISGAFSPDGQTLALGGRSGGGQLVDALAENPPVTLHGQGAQSEGDVTGMAFSPNGRRLVLGSADGIVWIWDLAGQQGDTLPRGWTDRVTSVAFSSNGNTVAAGGFGGSISLWGGTTSLPQERPLQGSGLNLASIRNVVFSPDDTRLASVGTDGTLIVWDVKTGRPLYPALVRAGVTSAVFIPDPDSPDPDGLTLHAAGMRMGDIILWDKLPASPIVRACQIANRNMTQAEWIRYMGPDEEYRRTCPDLPLRREESLNASTR